MVILDPGLPSRATMLKAAAATAAAANSAPASTQYLNPDYLNPHTSEVRRENRVEPETSSKFFFPFHAYTCAKTF